MNFNQSKALKSHLRLILDLRLFVKSTPETVNQRRTDNAMAKWKRIKWQTIIYNGLSILIMLIMNFLFMTYTYINYRFTWLLSTAVVAILNFWSTWKMKRFVRPLTDIYTTICFALVFCHLKKNCYFISQIDLKGSQISHICSNTHFYNVVFATHRWFLRKSFDISANQRASMFYFHIMSTNLIVNLPSFVPFYERDLWEKNKIR